MLSGGMKFETDKAASSLRRANMRIKVWESAGKNQEIS
ncbi:MAG: hypothetical protein LBQ67_05460 [Treponema sp.]|nr:hypothetical protein [Treponema sp.]